MGILRQDINTKCSPLSGFFLQNRAVAAKTWTLKSSAIIIKKKEVFIAEEEEE